MWIKKKEYEQLKDCELMKASLEDEVVRLARLISDKVENCQIGPWCEDCKFIGQDKATIMEKLDPFNEKKFYVKKVSGKVWYCKKHIYELCPEFEFKREG